MKRIILLIAVIFIFTAESKGYNYYSNSGFNYFYSHLAPYGEWIQLDIDFYVWKPYSTGVNWRPYTNGKWHWTSNGWYWESFEPFGWATFHYGRWYYDDYYGWVWIPGDEWAPAWVEWRYDDHYIGWAPLPPYAEFRINVGIHFNVNWRAAPVYWSFVKYKHFYGYRITNYVVPHYYVERILPRTRYRTNIDYRNGRIFNEGIDRRYVERRSGRNIKQRDLGRTTKLRDNPNRNSNSGRLEVFAPSKDRINDARLEREVSVKRGDRKTNLRVDRIPGRDERQRIETPSTRQREKDRRNDRPGVRNRNDDGKFIPSPPSREREEIRKRVPNPPKDNDRNNNRRKNNSYENERKIERDIKKKKFEPRNDRSKEMKKSTRPKIKDENRKRPEVKAKERNESRPAAKSKSRSSNRAKRK